MSTRFSDHTLVLLRNRPRNLTVKKISEEAKISEAWLAKFLCGKGGGADNVEKLYIYLTGYTPDLMPIDPKFYNGER